MRWKGRKESSNVEDRRGMSFKGKGMVGGGIGTIAIVLVVLFLGGDPTSILQNVQSDDQTTNTNYTETAEDKELAQFVGVVLAETESVWHAIFKEAGFNISRTKTCIVQRKSGISMRSCGCFYRSFLLSR